MTLNKFIFFLGSLTIAAFSTSAQNKTESFDLYGVYKRDSVTHDLEVLKLLLTEVHSGINQHTKEEKLSQIIDSIKSDLPAVISGREFHSITSFILAQMKDGHTFIPWQESCFPIEAMRSSLFPLHITLCGDKYYIKNSVKEDYKKYIGYEIMSINNRDIKDVSRKIYQYSSFEGSNTSSQDYKLFDLAVKYYLLEDTSGTFEIKMCDPNGAIMSTRLNGVTFSEQDTVIYKIIPPAEYEIRENVAILKIHSFLPEPFEQNKKAYKIYFDDFFSMLKKKKIKKLVIDLRGNEGGRPEVSNELFSCLYSKEYYYFEYQGVSFDRMGDWKKYLDSDFQPGLDTTKSRSENGLFCYTEADDPNGETMMTKFKGKKKAFKGEIVAVIDGGCYSTTGHFVSLLKYYNLATLIGTCSHGSYYSNDGGVHFRLPYSKLQLRIPVAQSKMRLPGFKYDSAGICPDLKVDRLPEDLKSGYDRQLQNAISFLKTKK